MSIFSACRTRLALLLRHRRVAALCAPGLALLLLCPSLAAAASYVSAAAPFSWIDASTHAKLGPSTGGVYSPSYQFTNPGTCGTNLPAIDDAISDNLPIGFTFTYGGASFAQARVMSNGRLQFNDNAMCGYGSPVTQLPYPDANLSYTMRIYGADLDPSLQGEVGSSTPCVSRDSCYVSYATLGSAPNRLFVVTWSNVPEWANFGEAVGNYNLQIILQENGDFIYQYGPHTPGPGNVAAQIGWEVDMYDYDVTAVGYPADNSAIRFYTLASLITNGGFNAFESATAAGAVSGVIHTKIAGAPFNTTLDVVALNTDSSAVLTTFTGDVKVELLDAHDNSGALSGSCRASWAPISGTATTLTFAGADAGRKTVTLAEPNAWREVRVRISTPATGTPTTVGCSTDAFAIRPASFASFSVTDTDWQSAGTGRSLNNLVVDGGVVHKAGQPFTVRASAVNAAAATTSNYLGTASAALTACAGGACPATLGSFAATSLTATAGAISSSATYSEVGAFTLQLTDTSFTSVDAADGSSPAELTIASPLLAVGRFVPDHYELISMYDPLLKTFGTTACGVRSFTYVGQTFNYESMPEVAVYARNAAGATTLNASNAMWKVVPASITQVYTPLVSATPGLDSSLAIPPQVLPQNNGSAFMLAHITDAFAFTRPSSPMAPFAADIGLSWTVADSAESAVTGNGVIISAEFKFANINFDHGKQLRFGILHLTPAYGSELLPLPVTLEARYWDGLRWAVNAADQCTTLAASATAMGNYQKNLTACKTAIPAATATLANGRTTLTLAKPGSGNNGSVDLTLQLGASASGQTCSTVGGAQVAASAANLPWLLGGAAFDQNPSTRASFGQYKSKFIFQRESY